MSINLTQLIANLEAEANAADINTSISDLTRIAANANRLGGTITSFDSAGAMPIGDSDYLGMVAFAKDTESMYVYTGNAWGAAGVEAVEAGAPWVFQGTVSGYTSGGNPGPTQTNIIDKFPFAADGNATDVGDLTVGRYSAAGQQV